jgi:uncharacterized protein
LKSRGRLQHAFMPAGDASLKTAQVNQNAIDSNHGIYRLNLKAADARPMPAYSADRLAQLKKEYEFAAKEPSNPRYGYVRAG